MAAGFRKSLFGFNCADVMEYIEKSQKTFVKNEKDLTEQVETGKRKKFERSLRSSTRSTRR